VTKLAALAQTRRDRLIGLAQFYKALGGGWQGSDAVTGASTPAPTR
jgi:outer membrane protein TolC